MEKAVHVLKEIHLDNCPTQVLFNYEIYSPTRKLTAHNGFHAHVHGKGIPNKLNSQITLYIWLWLFLKDEHHYCIAHKSNMFNLEARNIKLLKVAVEYTVIKKEEKANPARL